MQARTRTAALVAALTWLAADAAAAAVEIEGVRFAPRVSVGTSELDLHGVALSRYRVIIKAYAAALYLSDGVGPERVLDDVPRRLEIEYFWPIPADAFARATQAGIARNVDPRELDRLRERIERFNRFYADVKPGDRYALTYVPGSGTRLALNGREQGTVEGADFAAALFSIWLGEAPFDAGLKASLLGTS